MCERGGLTNRDYSDLACSCFGDFKTRRETKLSALWWLVICFKVVDTFAIKCRRLVS